ALEEVPHLIHVHLIDLPALRLRVLRPPPGLCIEAADRGGVPVPGDRAQVADDLAAALVGALEIVQSDVRDGPARVAADEHGEVFDIQYQLPEPLRGAGDFADLAQVPAGQVDFVDDVQDHAAAHSGAGAVALPVVLPGPPVREVLPKPDPTKK